MHRARFIELDRSVTSATTRSSILAQALREADLSFVNLGQGGEITEFKPLEVTNKLIEALRNTRLTSSAYNAGIGGKDVHKAAAADFIRRFLGIPATATNTFMLAAVGCVGLDQAFRVLPRKGEVLLPDTFWSVISTLVQDWGHTREHYRLERGKLGQSIPCAVTPNTSAIYVGTPANPSGLITTKTELLELAETLAECTAGYDKKPPLILDIPYFHAAQQWDAPNSPYLDLGFTAGFFESLETSGIDWVAVISGSKAFGTATPGFSLVTVSPPLAKSMTNTMADSAIGRSYASQHLDAYSWMISPENDTDILGHFSKLRDKYVANNQILETALQQAGVYLLDGDPAMTRLAIIDPSRIIGKTLKTIGGENHTIENGSSVVEVLANLEAFTGLEGDRVVTVDNGTYMREGKEMIAIRFACAAEHREFQRGAEIAARGLYFMSNAPV